MQAFFKLSLRCFSEVNFSRVRKLKQLFLFSVSSVGWLGWKMRFSLQTWISFWKHWMNFCVLNFRFRLLDLRERSKVFPLNAMSYRIIHRPIRLHYYCQKYFYKLWMLKNRASVQFLGSHVFVFHKSLKFFGKKVKKNTSHSLLLD